MNCESPFGENQAAVLTQWVVSGPKDACTILPSLRSFGCGGTQRTQRKLHGTGTSQCSCRPRNDKLLSTEVSCQVQTEQRLEGGFRPQILRFDGNGVERHRKPSK